MIVVTGATGNVGRPLVGTLEAAGAEVRAVSRHPRAEGRADGRAVELADPESLRAALTGAEALYLLVPGGGSELDPQALVGTAKAAGVRRLVLQSSQLTGTRPEAASHAVLRAFESAVRESGLEWTVLRPGGFQSNALFWAESVRRERTVAAPFADTGLPLVHPADIAAVAAAVLTEPGPRHAEATYVLTGPEAVTPRQQAAALEAAVGEPLRFVELTRAQAREGMLAFMPPAVADGTLSVLGEPSPEEQRPSDDVTAVLGRSPRPFTDWAHQNADSFR